MKKLLILVAGGVGYVFGAKAGRGRYDQLRTAYDKVRNDPRVQEKTQQAADLAKEKAPVVKDKLAEVADTATAKVKATAGSNGSGDLTDQLNPESTVFQDNPGPQGELP